MTLIFKVAKKSSKIVLKNANFLISLKKKKFGRNPKVSPTRFATEAIRFSLLLDFYPQIAEFVTKEKQEEQVLEYGSDYLKFHVSFVIFLFGISWGAWFSLLVTESNQLQTFQQLKSLVNKQIELGKELMNSKKKFWEIFLDFIPENSSKEKVRTKVKNQVENWENGEKILDKKRESQISPKKKEEIQKMIVSKFGAELIIIFSKNQQDLIEKADLMDQNFLVLGSSRMNERIFSQIQIFKNMAFNLTAENLCAREMVLRKTEDMKDKKMAKLYKLASQFIDKYKISPDNLFNPAMFPSKEDFLKKEVHNSQKKIEREEKTRNKSQNKNQKSTQSQKKK